MAAAVNTDWSGYSDDFGGFDSRDAEAQEIAWDGLPFSAEVAVGAYSALVYSQDR